MPKPLWRLIGNRSSVTSRHPQALRCGGPVMIVMIIKMILMILSGLANPHDMVQRGVVA
jgi:hypothetical protein